MSRWTGAALCAALLVTGCEDLLGTGGGDGGGAGGNGGPSTSGEVGAMQAIAQLVVLADDGDTTAAQLNVLTTIGDEVTALTGVSDAYLLVGEEERSLPTTAFVGTFGLTTDADALRPASGDVVRFGYTVADTEGETYDVELAVTMPPLTLEAELPPSLIYFANEPLDLEVRNWADGGWVVVSDPSGAQTYSTVNVTVQAAPDSLASIRGVRGPIIRIPGEAFPVLGTYTIELVTMAIADAGADGVTPDLGAWSYIGAGQRITLDYTVE